MLLSNRARVLTLMVGGGLVLGLLTGCPATLPEGATALDSVSIEGTHHVDESDVLEAMASDPTHKLLDTVHFWWVDYGIYDRVTLDKDMKRIERYYRARGYYEARVVADTVDHTGPRSVRVRIVVEEGPKVTVAALDEHGLDALPIKVQKDVHAAWLLSKGSVFEESRYQDSAKVLQRTLTDDGYAYATVRVGSDVDLITHLATIHAEFIPGPKCTFGETTIVGLHELKERGIRVVLDIAPGKPYSTLTIRNAQRALFDLGVFDAVEIIPDLSKPFATVIPLTVKATESKLRNVKVGFGFLIDPVRDDVHMTAAWDDHNFLGGLRSFHADLGPILVLKPGLTDVSTVRPGFTANATLRQPSFIEARTVGTVGASTWILPDAVDDFRTFSARAYVGLDRRFGPVRVGLFYRKGFDLPTPYDNAILPANVFRAQIGYFELLASVDGRDNVVSPHKGVYAALSLQYAFDSSFFLAGNFGDLRLQPEVRGFIPITKRVTLAMRGMIGLLIPRNYSPHFPGKRAPTEDDPSSYQEDTRGDTPLWRAFFSGGATSNRGYATQYVGLRDCSPGEVGQACDQVIGGASLWEGSAELRMQVSGPFSVVLFLDGSDVSRDVLDIRLNYPHLATGPGLRYLTPVGPIRVDFGWRLPGLQRIGGQLDAREQPPEFDFLIHGPFALHISIGEAF